MKDDSLVEQLVRGDRGGIARAITKVENREKGASRLLERIGRRTGNAFVVGITGAPGTGKSTLVDRMMQHYKKKHLKIGVIAVDPSSPFTGGALLGDRIRMTDHTLDESIFIRSMASRGWSGGLSAAAADVVQILDAAGFRIIFLETAGIGQADIEVMRIAHVVVIVVMPGMGDDIQVSKAGLMEIGDVYAVNKSDLEGSNQTATSIINLVRESRKKRPVVRVSAVKDEGVGELVDAIEAIRTKFDSDDGREMKMRSIRGMIFQLAKQEMLSNLEGRLESKISASLIGRVADHRLSLESAVKRLSRD